jgi:FAD/FMN-containing dehydrogenase
MNAAVPADAISKLKAVLGPDGWSDEPARLQPKLVEWRGRWTGHTPLLCLPRTTEEVSAVVAICAEHGVAVTPQGGNTGLVGGQTPFGEVLVSLEKMRRVREVHPIDDVMVLEAGVTLYEAQQAAEATGRLFPLSIASEGTATIGGVISSNAGGTAVLRYGNARDLVLGLEAVLPSGEVWNGLKRLRKDNTGYDLKQLLIGAEGTLGVVTAAALKLFPVPKSRATALVGLESPAAALDLLVQAKEHSAGMVDAFELMSRRGLDAVLKHIPDTRDPLSAKYPWYVLMEIVSSYEDGALNTLAIFLGEAYESGRILDSAVAFSEAQAAALWKLREEHSAAQKPEGAAWKHDVSVPLSRVPEFLETATLVLEQTYPGVRVVAFGHMGDGNIHYDVLRPEDGDDQAFLALRDEGSRIVHDVVHAMGGSISAEHGLGRLKTEEALGYKSAVEVAAQRAVRAALDPKRIMNPRVLF